MVLVSLNVSSWILSAALSITVNSMVHQTSGFPLFARFVITENYCLPFTIPRFSCSRYCIYFLLHSGIFWPSRIAYDHVPANHSPEMIRIVFLKKHGSELIKEFSGVVIFKMDGLMPHNFFYQVLLFHLMVYSSF